jgi:hypothetical protein
VAGDGQLKFCTLRTEARNDVGCPDEYVATNPRMKEIMPDTYFGLAPSLVRGG